MEQNILKNDRCYGDLNLLPVAIFEADLRGRLTFVNEIGCLILGYAGHEMLGQSFFKFIAPEDRSRAIATAQNVLSGKYLGDNEFTILKKDASRISAFIQSRPVKNGRGETTGLRGAIVQIIRDKSIEAKIRASEEKYRSLVNNIKLGVTRCSSGLNATFLEVNKAMEDISGYSREELLSMQVSDLYFERHEREKIYEEIVRASETIYPELKLKKKDGSIILVSAIITPVKDPDGNILYLDGILEDITGRKKAEEALKQSEQKYRSLVNNMPLGIFRTTPDPAGRFLEFNQSFERITGYSREELMAIHVSDLYWNPDDRKLFLDEMVRAPQKTTHEFFFRKKDHSRITALITSYAVRDENGEILYFDGSLEDITARKTMEERIVDLYENEKVQRKELQEEARTRSLFLDILAHELRNPLAPIISSSSMLQDILPYDQDHVTRKLVFNIKSGAEAMAARLEELLELARCSRGSFKLNLQPTRVGSSLEEIISRFKPSIEQRHQHLTVAIADNLPVMELDPSRLEQVLVNLLSNASKFTPENGHISLRTFLQDGMLKVEVQDDGIGISPENQKSIFQPYHIVDQDRKKYPGLGLGLTVSKQIIEAHGGTIQVTSQLGQGSTFSFSIPLK